MKKIVFTTMSLLAAIGFVSCSDDDDNSTPPPQETTSFRITLTNKINNLSTKVFNTPEGATAPGPLVNTGDQYKVSFYATPGSKLSFVSMLANSNDWFFAPDGSGVALFNENGSPITGSITSQLSLWDAGTEEEDPTTIATEPDGAVLGDPDDDTSVRVLPNVVSNYFNAELTHDGTKFTLSITRTDTGIVTPGLLLVHTQDNPFFTAGFPDRGVGLKLLAEAGMPSELYNWYNEVGTSGAPLRLASSHTPFAPGVAYTFRDQDPFFTQGSPVIENSGLESLSEDGDIAQTLTFFNENNINGVANEETGIILPGGTLTFNIEATPGDKLGFATMFVQSNDWFLAFNNDGVALFNEDGTPKSGSDYSVEAYLFDAGTEIDEPVGTGASQAPRQGSANIGAPDSNPLVRRVMEIDDIQFDKGVISSSPGVVALNDARGGYNLISVSIEVQN